MKRDIRLQGLSRDHHLALVLALEIKKAFETGLEDEALLKKTENSFQTELAPHFNVEEELLLPALEAAGFSAIKTRTLSEHEEMKGHLVAAGQGSLERLMSFAELLESHVRFEEHELFPLCEKELSATVLEAVSVRTGADKRPS